MCSCAYVHVDVHACAYVCVYGCVCVVVRFVDVDVFFADNVIKHHKCL